MTDTEATGGDWERQWVSGRPSTDRRLTDTEATGDDWEQHAAWWQREFTDGADPEYVEQMVPLVLQHLTAVTPLRLVVDVGCGEGQVARAVGERTGALVVGVDPTEAQIRTAQARGGAVACVRAPSHDLPLAAGVADAAIVCLVLEHVDAMEESLAEIARVLRPGGRLVLLLNHPLIQTSGSALIVDHMVDPPETYWRIGPYLAETAVREEVTPGEFVRFLHRPMSRYLRALVAGGLNLVHADEPAPPPGFVAKAPEYEHEIVGAMPRLLLLVAERVDPRGSVQCRRVAGAGASHGIPDATPRRTTMGDA